MMDTLSDRLEFVRQRVADASRMAGRDPEAVELVAVSKTFPAGAILEAMDSGQIVFGESRVQELESKAETLPDRVHWHFIGPLQRNKLRKAIRRAEVIHSIDSLDLARDADRIAAEEGRFPKVYLQANLAAEESKRGFLRGEILDALDELLSLDRLQVLGLMTIPPWRGEDGDPHPDFAALRGLRDELEERGGVPLPGLSMGMSHDFEAAIAEGATSVRVGSAIFGERRR